MQAGKREPLQHRDVFMALLLPALLRREMARMLVSNARSGTEAQQQVSRQWPFLA